MHKRLNNPISLDPSIDANAHSGRGTKVRVNDDNGLTSDRRGVHKIVRGGIEVAPAERVTPDNIGAAGRMNVVARSGNDSRLHDAPKVPNGGMWATVGVGDEVATAPRPTLASALFAAALIGGLWFIVKGGR